jgi:UDP-galactopyranose mutase
MFEAMLDHPNITVETGVDWEDVRADTVFDHLIYTGPIDEYFDSFGALPYRSLKFRHETHDREWFQDRLARSTIRRRTCPTRGSANTST